MAATQRHRALSKPWNVLFLIMTSAGILLSIYQLFLLGRFTGFNLIVTSYLYLLLAIFLSLTFIVFPASKRAPRDRVPWYDAVLFVVALGTSCYFAYHAPTLTQKAWEFTAPLQPMIIAGILWLLVLEAARRAAGTALFIIVLIVSLYPLYAGHMPEIIAGFSLSFQETASYHAMGSDSIVGLPMRVVGNLFIGFLIMGAALVATGAGQFFINLSSAILGTFRGGPAKVAIVASGFFGSMSGSVVSNVLATGSFTIPAMKRIGYPPRYAAGIEACASTGGVLMPPIMGATAFLMASMLGMPYLHIAVAAAIPSILYYLGLFMQIDAYAARVGMKGLPRQELPSFWQTLKEGWFYIVVMAVLIWLLVYLRQEALAPFYATVLLLLLANVRKETRLYFHNFLDLIVSIGRILAEIVTILAAVGLIIGSLSVTGMALTLSADLVEIAGGNLVLLLVMGAVTSLILGTGMTVTACYIFLAITLAPALSAAGLNTLAVHLFLMYWGMISFITPPVCVGAYAAASIAQADPIRTGFESMRLGAVIYFLPFFFVLNPVLVLQGATPVSFLIAFGTAAIGILLIAGSLQGYMVGIGPLRSGLIGWLTRLPLIVGGALIGWPGAGTSMIGAVLAVITLVGYLIVNKRAMQAGQQSPV